MKPNPLYRVPAALCVALLGAACAAGPQDDRLVDDLPELTLTEEVRIGSVDDPDLGFSSISSVIAGEDGLVYVLERSEKEVRVYRDEQFVMRFGGAGSGPGEFESPMSMGLLGDTLWVLDLGNQRLSMFSRAGTYIGSYNTPPVMIEPRPGITVMLRAGGLRSDGTLSSTFGVMLRDEAPADTLLIPVVRMDTSGAVIDTIRYQKFAMSPRSMIDVGGRSVTMPGPPATSTIVSEAADGGLFTIERPLATTAAAGEFTVTRTAAAGDTLYSRTFRYRPHPWSDAAIDSLVASRDFVFEMMGVDIEAGRAATRKALTMPDFQPGIGIVRPDGDGSLWLRSEDAAGPTARWLLLDPAGSPRGVITVPRNNTLRETAGDVAWFVEPDDMDVPWLVRYRIGDAK